MEITMVTLGEVKGYVDGILLAVEGDSIPRPLVVKIRDLLEKVPAEHNPFYRDIQIVRGPIWYYYTTSGTVVSTTDKNSVPEGVVTYENPVTAYAAMGTHDANNIRP